MSENLNNEEDLKQLSKFLYIGFYSGKSVFERYLALLRARKLILEKYGFLDKRLDRGIESLKISYLKQRRNMLKENLVKALIWRNRDSAEEIKKQLIRTEKKLKELNEDLKDQESKYNSLEYFLVERFQRNFLEEVWEIFECSREYRDLVPLFIERLKGILKNRLIREFREKYGLWWMYYNFRYWNDAVAVEKDLDRIERRLNEIGVSINRGSFVPRTFSELEKIIHNLPEKH